ncbi:MAG TPA: O-antigen ligase family protein [Patescibacteria group bacterium]|nr:O-antigen ligase family protein [Patescibacteria group bacterium]
MTRQKAVSLLRGISLVGIYGGLLMPLMFLPVVIFPFVFSKLIFFQVLIGLTFPAYLVLAWMEPAYRPRFHLLYGAIAAYFLALLLSVIFSVDPFRSWWGNQERMNGLFTLLHLFAWLTMAIGVLKTWTDWRRLLNYQAVLSLFMAIVALLEKPYPNLLLFPAGDRVGGLLDNPIYMAAYQIFNFFFLLLLALKVRSKNARILYGVIGFFDILAFIFAQSRGALVGLGMGILAFGIWVAVFSKNKRARTATLGIIALLFIGYGILFAARNTSFVQHSALARLTNLTASVDTRFIAWKIAWQGFLARPITGWGLDTFHLIFNKYYNPRSLGFGIYETWFDRSHNTVLDVLSMTGLLGFVTFAGIFITLFYASWRAYRKGWIDLPTSAIFFALPVAYFVQNLFVFDHPAAFSMSFLMYGLIIAATSGGFALVHKEAAVAETHSSGKTRNFSWILYGGLEILGLLLVWRTSILPFQASRDSIRANANFANATGLQLAQKAAAIWTPYLDEQTFLLSRNLIQYAGSNQLSSLSNGKDYLALDRRLTEEEIARHPLNTNPRLIYAELMTYLIKDVPDAASVAEAQFKTAIQTSPKRQQLYLGLAALYAAEGRNQEVMDIYKEVRDFDLQVGETRWIYGIALFYDLGNKKDGASEIIASQTVERPHVLQNAHDLIPIADAYLYLNDKNGLSQLVNRLPDTPAGSPDDYAELAIRYEVAGMLDLRDRVISYGEQAAPGTTVQFNQLKATAGNGSAPKKT